ncbi:PP2C-like phosphatase [Cryptosporidium ubiquitum]|uniref:PP2C-like phosphatase n=1 Tax=Cryptosporidium ubiquitum TaxID=857276 RepID=A0A1J4MPI5_9CRYT|nr:PP2C-like phosphatase [Cryptosporidium ubiquitum]OII74892.1 PP2C-like phosphatase [Cryptosporidium ubiquitum]
MDYLNLKPHDIFREITKDLLRGENVKFYLESRTSQEISCEENQFLEFVNQYYINKKRSLDNKQRCDYFKIPLLIDSNGKIIKIGWSLDWDKNLINFNSESAMFLSKEYKFIYLYAVYDNFKDENIKMRLTAGSKLQTEKRDPQSITLNCGFYETKGTRSYMEDRTFLSLDVLNQESNTQNKKPVISFFGIYDGHNGEFAVDYLKNHLHKNFSLSFNLLNYGEPIQNTVNALVDSFYLTENQIKKQYFNSNDKQILKELETIIDQKQGLNINSEASIKGQNIKHISSGSTAIVCCITSSTLCIANLGDSRAILCKCGRAYSLTKDHRIKSNFEERERVKSEGGTFDDEGYLSGNLAVSRAFGNWDVSNGMKLQGLSSTPEIYVHNITHEDEFLLIACDGIFESFMDQEAISLIRRALIENSDPNVAAEKLISAALQRQALDNLSTIIVVLTPPNYMTIGNNNSCVDTNPESKKKTNYGHSSNRKIYNFSKLKNLLLT